jgi:DNA-directed RNA polymerase subunit beta'
MGHINLAAPVAHIWFFKAMPSRIGNAARHQDSASSGGLLPGLHRHRSGHTPLKEKQLLTEDEYRKARAQVRRFGLSKPTWAPKPSRRC